MLTRILREKTSIKDAIEACGVPHPEVDLVQSNGAIVPFEHQLQTDAVVEVYGVVASPATAEEHLQQRRLARFVVDGTWAGSRAICRSWASTSSNRRTRQMICSSRLPQLKIVRW
ncbi:MAG: hypothetical protein M3505_13855 [Verrucomicrobiota bacterium]|nr:hypothetical protein [Verrucomicrobiota bacterium]